jgi:hypothetical protein
MEALSDITKDGVSAFQVGSGGGGGQTAKIVNTTPYTVLGTDTLLLVDTSTRDIVVNLVPCTGNANLHLTIVNDRLVNKVVVTPNGTDTLDNTTSPFILFPGETLDIVAYGTAWRIV